MGPRRRRRQQPTAWRHSNTQPGPGGPPQDVYGPVPFPLDLRQKGPKVRGPLQLGKLARQGRLNAIVPGSLLHVTDRATQKKFLVDTGASSSILPNHSPTTPSGPSLTGPDGTPIPCCGGCHLQLEFGRRRFLWDFLLAAVNFPIIGVDFLKHY
jgi:hypothetical protein